MTKKTKNLFPSLISLILDIVILFIFSTLISCVSTKAPIPPSEGVSQGKEKSPAATSTDNKKFLDEIDDLLITVISNPCDKKTIYKNKTFPAPYIIKVTKNGTPLKGASITVSFPVERDNDVITYSCDLITTNDEGVAQFTPPVSKIAVSDTITFYPTPASSDASVTQAAFDKSATASYLVKSDVVGMPGGILYVYDFNEKGQLTKENFTLLKHLRNAGVNAGNSPVSDQSYLNRDAYALYKACKPIVTGQANFLIYGTFKYLEAHDNEVTLQADVTCLSMKDGSQLYKTSITQSAQAKDKRSADSECREAIAAVLAHDVIFSM